MTRARWLLLLILSVLLGLLLFGLPLYGTKLLSALPGDYVIQASRVSGPIWKPTLHNATVTGTGIRAEADRLRLNFTSINPFTREVIFTGAVVGAEIDLNVKQLLSGQSGNNWKFVPQDFTLENVRVNLDNTGYNLPNARLSAHGADGRLNLQATTPYGGAKADIQYAPRAGELTGTADVRFDATLINAYWGGVRGGVISGTYSFDGGELHGDLSVKGGRVVVPQAKFARVHDIHGTIRHRGAQFDIHLNGQGWNGPVEARANVDTAREHWSLKATARPTVAGLANALGTTGRGQLLLRAEAQGWDSPTVHVNGRGQGELAGVPFQELNAAYSLIDQVSRVRGSARTQVLGEQQRLNVNWTPNGEGKASAAGALLGEPLRLEARTTGNRVRVSGEAAGGPVRVEYDVKSRALSGNVDIQPSGVRVRASVKGQPSDLQVRVGQLRAGDLTLSGSGRLNQQGLKLDLGSIMVNVNRTGRGTWRADDLRAYGVTLNGTGRVDAQAGNVSGQLKVNAPLVDDTLSGPVSANWRERNGTWSFGTGELVWRGKSVRAALERLRVAGLETRGTLTYEEQQLTGNVTATGEGIRVNATARGENVRFEGRVRGVRIQGNTNLSAGYRTSVQVDGTKLTANLRVQDGVRFDVRTLGEQLTGRIAEGRVEGSGSLNLAAFREVTGLQDLTGRLEMTMTGDAGRAQLNATAAGTAVSGQFIQSGDQVRGDVTARTSDASVQLSGPVFPRVNATGNVTWRDQTVPVSVRGPFGQLQWSARGVTTPVLVGGVIVPAQPVRATGTLTPSITGRGVWGDLNVSFAQGRLTVSGNQAVTAFGEAGSVNVQANLERNGEGSVRANGQLAGYALTATGPWQDVQITVNAADFNAQGRVNARTLEYAARARGRAGGLYVDATVTGQNGSLRGAGRAYDGAGGAASFEASSLEDWNARFTNLNAGGFTLNGTARAVNGLVNGDVRVNDLRVTAQNGRLNVDGEVLGATVRGSGRLNLPRELTDVRFEASGEWGVLTLRGPGDQLAGSLQLRQQRAQIAGTTALLDAVTLPVRASLTTMRATVGGLTYSGGRYAGSETLRYRVAERPGTVLLRGNGNSVNATLSGVARGSGQVLPAVRGQFRVSLSPFAGDLPQSVRSELQPGELIVQVAGEQATLRLEQSRYVGAPLELNANVTWTDGVRLTGSLTHPGSRVPFTAGTGGLTVRNARIDALALRPFIQATGAITGDAHLPASGWQQGRARVSVNLTSGTQSARGQLVLREGTVQSDIRSTLGGRTIQITGPLYPQANATIRVDGVRGTARGDITNEITLVAAGDFEGRRVTVNATAGTDALNASAVIAGARIDVTARREAGSWNGNVQLNASDLRELTGQTGRVTGTISGSLDRATGLLSGSVSDVEYTLPVTWTGTRLLVNGGRVRAAQGEATVTGEAYPRFQAQGTATVRAYLPGEYTVRVEGTPSKPDVHIAGQVETLDSHAQGMVVNAPGTRIQARLFGRDWRVTASGPSLDGEARGQLGAGVVSARFTVDATARWENGEVRVTGNPGWNAKTGWAGVTRVTGNAFGQATSLTLTGQGSASLTGTVGRGEVLGTLPPALPLAPGGTLQLRTFDLGTLWGRAGQLTFTGTAALGGSWRMPDATVSGRLADTGGDFTGMLRGEYERGQFNGEFRGDAGKVMASAEWKDAAFHANLTARDVALARLLPSSLNVSALRFTGSVMASGANGTLSRVELSGVNVRGNSRAIGEFTAAGGAAYTPATVSSDLVIKALSGEVRASGQLPSGVRVTASNLNLEAFGAGRVNGQVILQGDVRVPRVSGEVVVSRDDAVTRASLSGSLRSPSARLTVDLRGPYRGRVHGEVQDVQFSPPSARVRVYGTAARGADSVTGDIGGVWPNLRGQVRAQLEALRTPVLLSGNGTGEYELKADQLAAGQFTLRGFVPEVTGAVRFTPLPLLDADGTGAVTVTATGPATRPNLSVSGAFRDVERAGVRIASLSVEGGGTPDRLTLDVRQGERLVGTFNGTTLNVTNLTFEAMDSSVTASGTVDAGGTAQGTLQATGAVRGQVRVGYAGRAGSASGTITRGDVQATFELAGSEAVGWAGRGRISGLPADVVTRDLTFTVNGPWNRPQLTGSTGLLGANAEITATTDQATLTLRDGPAAKASGELRLTNGQFSGGAALTRKDVRASIGLSGTTSNPSAALEARLGDWTASGTVNRTNGRLSVTDGERSGSLTMEGQTLKLDLPGLNLARLRQEDVQGILTAAGTFDLERRQGTGTLSVREVRSPFELPVVGVPVAGSLNATVTTTPQNTSVVASLVNAQSRFVLNAERTDQWTGRLTADITNGGGALTGDLSLAGGQLNGTVNARAFPLDIAGTTGLARGTLVIRDNLFTVSSVIEGAAGRVNVNGEGDLATAIAENAPIRSLELQPGSGEYRVDVRVDGLDLRALNVAPHLQGRVSATALLSDGGSTFVIRSQDLQAAGELLPARIEGTSFGTEWRVRGFVGDSQVFGSVTEGVLSGRLELRSLPLGGVLGAFSGPLPGRGVVSGLARFDVPLNDPLAGRVDVVAERIRISSADETLTGFGSLSYAQRELRNVSVQLRGAGTWDVSGAYTRERVDVRASLRGTTFTPILSIIPSVRDVRPTLRGDLEVNINGTYERPQAILTGRNFVGAARDVQFSLPSVNAQLSNGQLSANTSVSATGDVAMNGVVRMTALFAGGEVRDGRVVYDGNFASRASGTLQRVTAEAIQTTGGWNLDATIEQGGTARITGSLSPNVNLTFSARALTPQLGLIYARETNLDANLTIVETGAEYVVDGAVTFNRLILGRTTAPAGTLRPPDGRNAEEKDRFTSILPTELVTFPPPPGEKRVNPFLSRVVLGNIPILLPNGLRVDENLVRADLTGNLSLAGRASEPRVTGQVQALRGTLFLRENEFTIAEGRAVFDGSSAYPTFSAVARGMVQDEGARVGVQVSVSGQFVTDATGQAALDLDTRFSCTSQCIQNGREFTESELYALIAFGTSNTANLPSQLTQSALRTSLNVFLVGEIERSIGRALGLDVFRIRTNLLSGDPDFQVQFTLGGYLSRDFYLQYEVDLSGRGLLNATYTTPDSRFTFTVTSPLQGLDVSTLQPSFAVGYNFTPRSSVQFGVTSGRTTTFRLGYSLKF